MTAVVSVLAMAILFAAFAWVRPRPGCGGSCGSCEGPCELEGGPDEPARSPLELGVGPAEPPVVPLMRSPGGHPRRTDA